MIFRHPINKLRGKWNERNERRSREPSREPSPVPSTAGTPPPPDQPARCELSATSQPTNEMNREQSPPFATPPIATPPIATPPVPSPQITITVVAETAVQYCNPRQMLEHTCALARERLTTEESQDIKTDEPSGDKAESAVEEIRSKIFPSQDSKTDEPSGDKAESAMEEIRRALDKKRSMEKNSKTQQRIVKILKIMDKYCTIVDVAIQHHPDITALVWAGVRTFLMVALNHYETLENLEEAMETITTTMAKSEFYCSIYASSILGSDGQSTKSHSKETTDALMGLASTLQKLYAAVIVVSVKARAYFQPSNFMVGLKNALNPFSTAFKDQLDEISKCEGVLHELANNAGLVNILENADLEFDQHRAKWMKGTCAWIRETDEYHALMDDRRRQHLWVHGQPGAGKSVLTSFVLKESRETMSTKSGCRIIHFFCKEGNPKTSSAAAIAANLVDQLVAKTPLKSFLIF
ncbi:hypothetical protein K440DRAFT_629494 [Wilcoxina mikolae CBS 423.85]|nr:hypothetical protein K440DRAFT_629494 [Wilcoxina mikolae CBS 423.85]